MISILNKLVMLFKAEKGRSQTVKNNIVGSFLVRGLSILISLLLVPLTLGYVSSELYGIWLTLSSILHWLTYMDVGFTLGLKNRLTEALAMKDYKRGKQLVSTTYFMMLIIFLPFSIAAIVICPYINWCTLLNVSSIYQNDIIKTVQFLSIFVSLQMIVGVFTAVVAAFQKIALSYLFTVLGQTSALIIIYVMTLTIKPSLPNLTLAYSMMPVIIIGITSFLFYRGKFICVCPNFRSIELSKIKDLWGLGVKFFIIQIQMIVLYQSANLLISNISGPIAVTQYNIAYKVMNVVAMLFSIVLNPLWPAFTDAFTKSDYFWMEKVYAKLCKFYMSICFVILIIVFASPIIYEYWVGTMIEIPLWLTTILAFYTLIFCWCNLQATLINGIGYVKLQTYVTLIGLFFHIPFAFFLGKSIGMLGVIISMCTINLIYCFVFTAQIHKILKKDAHGIWLQ